MLCVFRLSITSTTYLKRDQIGEELITNKDFTFVCSSSDHNISTPLDLYKEYFLGLPLDGVFLDKIRYASFAGGIKNGFGCFCPICSKKFVQKGVDPEEISYLIQNSIRDLLPNSLYGVNYGFESEQAEKFYRARADIITDSMDTIISDFRKLGLSVGLDVFAPVMSYLVGQDIHSLGQRADFVKPMFYRVTKAPAGLPFELDSLKQVFAPCGIDTTDSLKKLWNNQDLLSMSSVREQYIEVCKGNVYVRPGLEVNIVPEICDCNADYVLESRRAYNEMGADKLVLSWNLLGYTGNNIAVL